jgi:hypothetical protein
MKEKLRLRIICGAATSVPTNVLPTAAQIFIKQAESLVKLNDTQSSWS